MKHRASSLAVALGALVVMLAGCKDSTPPFEPPADSAAPRATRISPISPTAFHAPPGSRVTAPAVMVLDQFGRPMANIALHFRVVSGGGSVADRVVATDAAGRATAGHWILGAEPGENLVVATLGGGGWVEPVAFMAIGGLDPTEAVYGLTRISSQEIPISHRTAGTIGGYYILHEDGRFVTGFVRRTRDLPINSTRQAGRYARADSIITFDREGFQWTGTLRGDSLVIEELDIGIVEYVYAVTPPNSPPAEFPPVSSTASVYNRLTPSFIPGTSRYVLYEGGTFALQYLRPDWGFFEYRGSYSRADSVFTFNFDDWNLAGPWEANGIVHGDSLVVEYNIVMMFADFEDGVYVRPPAAHAYHPDGGGAAITRLGIGVSANPPGHRTVEGPRSYVASSPPGFVATADWSSARSGLLPAFLLVTPKEEL